jgi:holo-[acyl-carrier-protein] synthase
MIFGIGTDICDVRRIQASLERHGERFAKKILSDAELATWQRRSAALARARRALPGHPFSAPRRPSARPSDWA